MEIPSGLLSSSWLNLSWFLFVLVTLLAVIRAPWFHIKEKDSSNIYFATIVALLILWQIKANILPDQYFHFLGVGTATLMFGWEFAFLAVQILVAVSIFLNQGSWEVFAINSLVMGAIPAGVTQGALRLSQRYLPHNFFIYIFLNAFVISALGFLLSGMAVYYILLANHAYSEMQLQNNFMIVLIMAAIPEGTINGMTMTAFVAYKPQWVTTFRDNIYFTRKKSKK